MSDRITLTIPRERPFHPVAHLVLGGLAVRHNLTVEDLEDLQVALDELLDHDEAISDVTVELCVDDAGIDARIGPFAEATVSAATQQPGEDFGLARVLSTVVDRIETEPREGGMWLRLVKGVDHH